MGGWWAVGGEDQSEVYMDIDFFVGGLRRSQMRSRIDEFTAACLTPGY